MSYQAADFQKQLLLIGRKNRRYPRLVPEMQAIATGLNTDTTVHDRTIRLHPPAVRIGRDKTPFTNEALHLVNRGKGGNLANSTMATIINSSLGLISPPINTVAPSITGAATVGTQLINGSAGTWQPPAASYARQWRRNGANITGATTAAYVLAGADEGAMITCAVTGTNTAGSNTAISNAIGPITAP